MFFERNRWFAVAMTLFCTGVATGCTDDEADPGEEIGQLGQALAPPVPTPVSPSGPGISANPTYVWNSVAGATSYLLWVNDAAAPAGKIKDLEITAIAAGCGEGPPATCQTTPGTALALGSAAWWVRSRNAEGMSAWSNPGKNFDVGTATEKPAKVTINSPSGNGPFATPIYKWNSITGAGAASTYLLYVEAPPGVIRVNQIFTAAGANCNGGGECSVTPATVLPPGPARFYVRASNSLGPGPYSDPRAFGVLPAAPILTNPAQNATITTATPTYEWNASTGATSYRLQVSAGGNPTLIDTVLTPTQANCVAPDTTCAFTPATPLSNGAATFWVQARVGTVGPWSAARNFMVNVAPVNECALNTDNCDPAATCTDTPTGFTCTCPVGQIGDGTTCSCNLAGTFAVRDELDISWDEVRGPPPFQGTVVFSAGSTTTFSWSIRQQTVQNGTLQVSTIPCGATSPDLCSPLGVAVSQFLPDTIWQQPSMPVNLSSMSLTDPDPGEAFVGPSVATLGGINIGDPFAAWPPSNTSPNVTFPDHDADTFAGITQLLKTGTSTSCNLPYSNLPDPTNIFNPNLIDRVYVGSRLISSYSGTINSCDRISGNMLGPDNGKPKVNAHVAGCRFDNNTQCSSAVTNALDSQGQTSTQRINAARFTMKRDTRPNLNCEMVRMINFAAP